MKSDFKTHPQTWIFLMTHRSWKHFHHLLDNYLQHREKLSVPREISADYKGSVVVEW